MFHFNKYNKFNENDNEKLKDKHNKKRLVTLGIILIAIGSILVILGIIKIFKSSNINYGCNIHDSDWIDCERRKHAAQRNAGLTKFGLIASGMILLAIGSAMIYASKAKAIIDSSSEFIDAVINNNVPETKKIISKESKTCTSCGASFTLKNGKWKCPYCGKDF